MWANLSDFLNDVGASIRRYPIGAAFSLFILATGALAWWLPIIIVLFVAFTVNMEERTR